MPNWNQVLKEIQGDAPGHPLDNVRRKYLKRLSTYTGRPTIAYYSGWLGRTNGSAGISINDEDKNAFMTTVHGAAREKGLDLILHTPGGDLAATESIIHYLRSMFGTDIRVLVPQLAMSAGTMIACAAQSIVMGKQSNLGPIDPQIGGIPASGVIAEFESAVAEIQKNPAAIPLWQSIIGRYHPTFLGECKHAIDWGQRIATEWLKTGMFESLPDDEAVEKAEAIASALSDHGETKSHARHIHIEACEELGLKIERLEDDQKLQDLLLTVHHAFMHTFSGTAAVKIVENERGISLVRLDGVVKQ